MRLNDTPCDSASAWRRCQRALEREFVTRVPGIRRDSSILRIDVHGDTALVLEDSVDDNGVGYHYVSRAFEPRLGGHLVEVQLYEGSFYRLISSSSGIGSTLDSPPIVSPKMRS